MDDVEYILRIVLRARDEMAAVLAKARTQIRGFAKDSDAMNDALVKLNGSMATFDKNMDGITQKLQAWRATLRETNDDGKNLAKTFDTVGKNADTSSKKVGQAVKAQDDLNKAANRLRSDYEKLANQTHNVGKEQDFAKLKFEDIGRRLEALAKQVEDHDLGRFWTKWARDAKAGAAAITHEQQSLERELQELEKQAQARENRAEQSREQILTRRRAQEQVRLRLAREGARIEREGGTSAEIRKLAAGYDKLGGSYRIGSFRARDFANEAERLRTSIRSTNTEADRGASVFDRMTASLKKSHASAAGFDNQLRGMGILAAAAGIDQLISAAIALGGELVSLAGSAVMAGGALGGALAAGASQALPVLGLLAGAAQRVKSVIDAVSQAQKLQQARFTDAEKGSQKAIDKSNALANAQDTVASANDRLAESRESLTKAQKEGADQLEDLIDAEQRAALAAKGAALDVRSAQEALAKAIATGASQLEIDEKRQALAEARQSRGRAGTTLKRATRDRQAAGGDVGNLDSVKSASKAVDDAEKAVTKANRGLDQAADKTDRAASTTMTAAANLNFLLSQLSPAERKLYEAGTHLYDNYKKIFQGTGTKGSGIYGVIIDSFTRAVEQVDKIMQMPGVIRSLNSLSGVIGNNIDKVIAAVADPAVLDQLTGIIDAAGENLGPVVDMVIDLGKAFLNISETANPALQDIIKFLGPIVEDFLGLTSNKDKMETFFSTGEKHLESWVNLVLAVVRVLAVLTGASMDEGKQSIDDLTKTINGWADSLQKNGDKVSKFFEDSRKAVYAIAPVLEHIGVALFNSFSAERVEKFAKVLDKVVVPALVEVIDMIGKITDFVSTLIDNPLAAQLAKWAVAFLLISKVASPITGVLANLARRGLTVGKFIFEFNSNIAKLVTTLEKLPGILSAISRLVPFVFGPWGIAIALIVVGIVLLLKHFGKLDDIWNAVKQTAQTFLDAITPAFKSLSDALADMGIKANSFKDVLGFLEKIGSALATFISTVLIGLIKGLGHIVAGAVIVIIRSLTGVIKIFHGLYEIVRGIYDVIFHMDFTRLLNGLEDMADGVMLIFAGIVEGLIEAFKGIGGIILTPFKAAWNAVKDFFGVKSPSTKAKELGHSIIDGIKDGLVGLAKWITAPYRRAWNAVNDYFEGKPKKLAEKIIDSLVAGVRSYVGAWKKIATWLWGRFKDAFDAAKNFGGTIVSAIVEGIKTLPGMLLKAIEDIGGLLINVGKSIGGKIVDGIKGAFEAVKGLIPGLGGDDKDKPKGGAAPKPAVAAPAVKFDIGVGAIPFGAKDLAAAQNIYGQFWQELRKTARDSTSYIQRQFREMRLATTQSSDKMYKDIRGSVADIQNSFSTRGKVIVDAWASNWASLARVAYEGLNYIGHQTNLALKALGEKRIDFGLTAPKKTDGKAIGGWIGSRGQRGRDRGFYSLGDGEAVLNWQHQPYVETALNAQYGFGLGGLFDHVGGYHAGGPEQKGFAGGGFPSFGAHPTNVIPGIAKLIELLQKRFPLLQVTSTTDHSLMTTSGNVSDHTTGHAVDLAATIPYMAKVVSFINSSGLWKSLKQGIHNPGLAVNRGERVDGPGFFTAAWPQHIDHIHLALVGMLGKVAAGVGEVARRLVTPGGSAASRLVQNILDRTRKSANTKIASSTNADAESYGTEPGKVGAGAGNIFRFFRSHGFTDEQAAAWVGNFQQESGLNPAIIQPNGEGHGLAQWGGGRFAALQAFARAHKKPWTDMGTQLAFVMYELQGSESAAYRAIKAAKSIEAATNAIGSAYERYGIKGDRSGPARAAFERFAGKFDAGGEIPGSAGEPVSILAHAREWVLNPSQQGFLASLIGTGRDTLKAMLGFTGGPLGFQGGGEVKRLTRRVARGLNPDDLLEGVDKALADVRAVMTAVNKLGKKFTNIGGIIDLATKDGGLLDNLRASIERQFAQAALKLRRDQFTVGAGRVVKRAQDDVEAAQGTLAQRRSERGDLTDERRNIQSEFDAVEKRRKGTKKGSDRYKDLTAKMVNLQGRLDESQERVVQNTEDIFNAQEDLAKAQEEATQKRLDAFQAITDSIKDRFTKRTAVNDLARRVATALGSPDLMAKVNENAASIVGDNLNELIAQLHQARTMGFTEQATALQADIDELYTQATELAQQAIKDQIDAINTSASRRMGRLDLFGRMADAMGVIGDRSGVDVGGEKLVRSAIFDERRKVLDTQRSGLQGALRDAGAAGNVGLIQDLTDQLAELDVSIAENTKAAFDAKVAQVTSGHDYTQSMLDLNIQLNDLTQGTEKANLLAQKGNDLTEKGNQLSSLLAETTPGTQQYEDLQKAILENKIALVQNTQAIDEATGAGSAPASYTSTAWQWFRSAFLTGTGQVMPQYTPPVMQSVGDIGPGGMASTSTTTNGATITNNFEINEAGQPIDLTKVSSTVVFAQSTAIGTAS